MIHELRLQIIRTDPVSWPARQRTQTMCQQFSGLPNSQQVSDVEPVFDTSPIIVRPHWPRTTTCTREQTRDSVTTSRDRPVLLMFCSVLTDQSSAVADTAQVDVVR